MHRCHLVQMGVQYKQKASIIHFFVVSTYGIFNVIGALYDAAFNINRNVELYL